jgi:alpha-mannosidase
MVIAWKLARRLRRLGFELVASSILWYQPLTLENSKPYGLVKGVLRRSLEVVGAGGNGLPAVVLCGRGTGLVLAEGKPVFVLDTLHPLAPLTVDGSATVEVMVEPRTFAGARLDYVVVELAGKVIVDWNVFRLGLRLLNLSELVEAVPRIGGGRDLRSLEDVAASLDPQPRAWQISLSHLILDCNVDPQAPSVKRGAGFAERFLALAYRGELAREHSSDPLISSTEAVKAYSELAMLVRQLVPRPPVSIHTVFYSHLDTPWLWSLEWSRTRAVGQAATMATIYRLYPELNVPYHVGPALALKWVQESGLLSLLADKVTPICSMWVEPDLWMSPGPLLARNLRLCVKTYEEVLALSPRIAWLPDSFGYPSSLPKLLKSAGIDALVIHKIVWNDRSKPSLHSFLWSGDDGTKIPVDVLHTSYAGRCSPLDVLDYAMSYRGSSTVHAYSCGPGDSGSPPTLEQVEGILLALEADLARPLDVDAYLEGLSGVKDVHSGDLYLEYHRGSYTTDAQLKAALWASHRLVEAANMVSVAGGGYEDGWEDIVLLTFHDTLAGTLSAEARRSVYEIIVKALARLGRFVKGDSPAVVNTLTWSTSLALPSNNTYVVYSAPPLSITPAREVTELAPRASGGNAIELSSVRVQLSNGGIVLTIAGARLALGVTVHSDRPHDWDAWEIDEYSLEKYSSVDLEGRATRLHLAVRGRGEWGYVGLLIRPLPDRVVVDTYVELNRYARLVKLWITPSTKVSSTLRALPYGIAEAQLIERAPQAYEQPLSPWIIARIEPYYLVVSSTFPRGVTVSSKGLGVSLARNPYYPNPELPKRTHVRLTIAATATLEDAIRLAEEGVRSPQLVKLRLAVDEPTRLLEVESDGPVLGYLEAPSSRAMLLTLVNPLNREVYVKLAPGALRIGEIYLSNPLAQPLRLQGTGSAELTLAPRSTSYLLLRVS